MSLETNLDTGFRYVRAGAAKEQKRTKHRVEVLSGIENLTPKLLDALIECARGVFHSSEAEQRRNLHLTLVEGGKIYYVSRKGKIIGFACSESTELAQDFGGNPGEAGLLFLTAAVRKENRNQGVYRDINRSRIEEAVRTRTPYVSVNTQNPIVETQLRKSFEESIGKSGSPIASVRFLIFRGHLKTGKPSTQEPRERCGVKEIDERYDTLDYENGEVFVIKAEISYKHGAITSH